MKKIFKIMVAALSVALVVSMAGCKSANGLKDKGKFIIALNAEFEPFEYMNNGKVVGIDIDMANAIAKDMGAKVEVQNMEFDSVVAAVASGKVDAGISGITKRPDREKSVDFSDPYYDASQVIIVKKGNTSITDKNSLKGKKIAVQKGTTGDDLAKDATGDANVERFSASTDAVTELKNGKVAAVVIDSFPAKKFVEANSDLTIAGKPLTSEKYCIAMHKGNTKLVEQVNSALKKLKDSGELDNIIKKYS